MWVTELLRELVSEKVTTRESVASKNKAESTVDMTSSNHAGLWKH